MTRSARALLALLCASVIFAVGGVARGAEPETVVVGAVGSPEDIASLEASLAELVGRLGMRLIVQRAERPILGDGPRPLAVVRVDLRGGGEVTIVIENGRTNEVLARRAVRWAGSPQVVIEATAHVIQASVEDVRDIEKKTPPPAPPPPAEPPPPPVMHEPSVREEHGAALDVGAFFGARAFGGSSFAALGGVALVGRLDRGAWSPGLWLTGAYHTPFDTSAQLAPITGEVVVRTRTLALRLLPSIELIRGASWYLEAGAGAGTDIFFTTPSSNALPSSQLGGDRTDLAPVATGSLSGHYGISSSVDVLAAASLDVDLAPRRWVIDQVGVHETVFEAARLRPAIVVGFSFGVAGADPYARTGAATLGAR